MDDSRWRIRIEAGEHLLAPRLSLDYSLRLRLDFRR